MLSLKPRHATIAAICAAIVFAVLSVHSASTSASLGRAVSTGKDPAEFAPGPNQRAVPNGLASKAIPTATKPEPPWRMGVVDRGQAPFPWVVRFFRTQCA